MSIGIRPVFEQWALEQGWDIGRADDNIVKIDDPSVSSHHAEIIVKDKRVTVRDLGSTNGTRIGGRKVQETELLEGDQIDRKSTRLNSSH